MYQQGDLFDFLSLAEFAYNNSISAITNVTPFFANNSHNRFEILRENHNNPSPSNLEIIILQKKLEKLEQHLRQANRLALRIFSEYVNNSQISPPLFEVGSFV